MAIQSLLDLDKLAEDDEFTRYAEYDLRPVVKMDTSSTATVTNNVHQYVKGDVEAYLKAMDEG